MALTEEDLILVPDLLSRWVRLPNGTKAHYVTSGETGPAVILCHGGIAGSSGTAGWRFMAPFLGKNGFRVYAPDLPGMGINENLDEHYLAGFKGAADFLHDFVNALCIDQFLLGGNSNGTLTAMMYATTHPERVLKLGLIGTAGNMLGVIDAEELARARGNRPVPRGNPYHFDGTEEGMRRLMEQIVHKEQGLSDDLIRMRTISANKNVEAFAKRGELLFNAPHNLQLRSNLKGRFEDLDIPTIYVCGLQDPAGPETWAVQEDALPNAQVFLIDDCGHQAQTDQPEIVNQLFLEFFRDGKVSRQTADRAGVSKRRPEHPNLVAQV